jgi:hypothetical protein
VFNKLREPPGPLCEFNNESNRAPLAVGEGDEIRYSGAYVFPTSGFWDKLGNDGNAANVTFMRLMGGAPGWGAALLVTKDGQIRFNANNGSATTQFLANPETIPKDNCWHFFDVYQKLSSNPAQAVNRLWIDGQERATVSGANLPANGSYGSIFAGIVQRINASSVILYNDMVGFGYGVPLYYIGCRGVDDNYPTG